MINNEKLYKSSKHNWILCQSKSDLYNSYTVHILQDE